jgi:hypothetical protein
VPWSSRVPSGHRRPEPPNEAGPCGAAFVSLLAELCGSAPADAGSPSRPLSATPLSAIPLTATA